MELLNQFETWIMEDRKLTASSANKYKRAVSVTSREMLEKNIIHKSIYEMNLIELDTALINIFANESFIAKNHKGNHMYSSGLKQFRYFVAEHISTEISKEKEDAKIIANLELDSNLTTTEKSAIIKARIGQGKYRKELLEKYSSKCIVTGIDINTMLVASHIKPWAISTNLERVDAENGLLLCANMDRLFDCGLITFTNDGYMKVSKFVSLRNQRILNLDLTQKVNLKASTTMKQYLEYHRDVLFIGKA